MRPEKHGLSLILAVVLLMLIMVIAGGCTPRNNHESAVTADNSSPTDTSTETIRLASFNIQVFGKTKAGKPAVMQVLAQTIARFDVVAIQEIRDKSGTAIQELEQAVDALGADYAYVLGPRLGRSRSKEQYAFMYRTDTLSVTDSYTFNDNESDLFHREPFIVHFRSRHGHFDFLIMDIHTDPDEATEEINALPIAVSDAVSRLNEPDIVIMGDFNSDCNYFDESELNRVFPTTAYLIIIPNSVDTTVGATDCTYDRIIISRPAEEDYTGHFGVFRYDQVFGLTPKQTRKVSDHYPVWAEFYIDKDTD